MLKNSRLNLLMSILQKCAKNGDFLPTNDEFCGLMECADINTIKRTIDAAQTQKLIVYTADKTNRSIKIVATGQTVKSKPRGNPIPAERRVILIASLCDHLAIGQPLTTWCKANDINRDTLRSWRLNDVEIDRQIARAREQGCESLVDECVGIADNANSAADVQRDKLRVWTRLQVAEKIAPRLYGSLVRVGDPDGAAMSDPLNKLPAATLAALVNKLGQNNE
jgi:hypothetical protein